ncbi:MAG: hypothetical protein KKA65_01260 [Nanoarchaeota archaeon]|nr:hypothetical protein [Nanoarchaeota archaeon]MBU4351942.1 hypothetical protein [Nanoarchaeota archaeon]MBU4456108.1 hypothetical protein [Nanoarchaeota archaeon]
MKNKRPTITLATLLFVVYILFSIILYFVNGSQMYRFFPIVLGIWIGTKYLIKKMS